MKDLNFYVFVMLWFGVVSFSCLFLVLNYTGTSEGSGFAKFIASVLVLAVNSLLALNAVDE